MRMDRTLELHWPFDRMRNILLDKLREQLLRDIAFLRGQGVMDYSILLGVHYPKARDHRLRF